MLMSQDAMAMGHNPAATFVCLAMALEEKPKLGICALACYEKALTYLGSRDGGSRGVCGWERCVVLQQLGMVAFRLRRFDEAERWLGDCATACASTQGHPRDASLFGGAFSTQQTKLEFAAAIEKIRAATSHQQGDEAKSRLRAAEARRLEAAATGDAVKRVGAQAAPSTQQKAAGETPDEKAKALWAVGAAVERRLKRYSYADEGPTVLVILDLNEHLGLGEEASAAVISLRQFRVRCETFSVDVQLRLRHSDGKIWHFHLVLEPLAREIVPEDTVPRLKGKEGKRRLEVKLFKRDKQQAWYGDIVAEKRSGDNDPPPAAAVGKKQKGSSLAPAQPEKGTLLNPLTPEELARLPSPSGDNRDNRPSAFYGSPPVAESVTTVAATPVRAAAAMPEVAPKKIPAARVEPRASSPPAKTPIASATVVVLDALD
jgi:hypothetical protein